MSNAFCQTCGAKLIRKELENEGMIPFCPKCGQYRFPMYNVAVSMIVVNQRTNKILLIQQYNRPAYILVAGYVNRTEQLEHAVIRELKEETNLEIIESQMLKVLSGKDTYREYPNGDKLYDVTAIFVVKKYNGNLKINDKESKKLRWFNIDDLPKNMTDHTKK